MTKKLAVALFDDRIPSSFWSKVSPEPNSGCWLWTGATGPRPKLWFQGSLQSAARVALEAVGVAIGHLEYADMACGVVECVNPCHVVARPLSALRSKTNRRPTDIERLAKKLGVPTATGCIEFIGLRDEDGYGVLRRRVEGRHREQKAHRIAWQLAHGSIPDGLVVMHKCDNPPCCNVEHLQLGTVGDNNRDRQMKGRTRGLIPGGPARVEEGSWP